MKDWKSIKLLMVLFALLYVYNANAQETKKILFIGNSYTYVNDLPTMVKSIAASFNDTVIKDQNTPGGYCFQQHTTNPTTLSKIAGNYTVQLITYSNNNCYSDTLTQTVNPTISGVDESNLNLDIVIFPNPAKDVLTFKNNSQKAFTEIKIMDLLGKEIKSIPILNQKNQTVDVSKINTGVYLIQLIDKANNVYTKKMIIE